MQEMFTAERWKNADCGASVFRFRSIVGLDDSWQNAANDTANEDRVFGERSDGE